MTGCIDVHSVFSNFCFSTGIYFQFLFLGQMCEADIDECQLGICKNGHCVNSVGKYPFLNFFFVFRL